MAGLSASTGESFSLTVTEAEAKDAHDISGLDFDAESGGAKAEPPMAFDIAAFEAPPLDFFSHLSIVAMVSGFVLAEVSYAEADPGAIVLPTLQAPVFMEAVPDSVEISGAFIPTDTEFTPVESPDKDFIEAAEVDVTPPDPPTPPEAEPTVNEIDVPDFIPPPPPAGNPPPPVPGDPNVDIFTPTGSPLPALFSEAADIVDFNFILAGTYLEGSQYNALGGDDEVILPLDAGAATASGYAIGTAFFGGAGIDKITGGDLADTIDGGLGADTIKGGMGDDILIYDSIVGDSIDGGGGTDTLFVSGIGITLDLAVPLGTLTDIETISLDGMLNTLVGSLTSLDALNGGSSVTVNGDSTFDNTLLLNNAGIVGDWAMSVDPDPGDDYDVYSPVSDPAFTVLAHIDLSVFTVLNFP